MFAGHIRLRILTALIGVTALVAARVPTIQADGRAHVQPPARLPLRFGLWEGEEVPVPPDVRRALPSASILSYRYRSPLGEADVLILSGADATALHDPHDCLVGDGWEFITDGTQSVDAGGDRITVGDVAMARQGLHARMWYWYQVGDSVYASTLRARLALFQARLLHGARPRAEFVRLIVGGETESARTRRMLADLTQAVRSASRGAPCGRAPSTEHRGRARSAQHRAPRA
ncbi:MAG: EpsI family protein [Chloroflexi bacterium]|nr:EpsI family protein [Chloroflexota bacterium]